MARASDASTNVTTVPPMSPVNTLTSISPISCIQECNRQEGIRRSSFSSDPLTIQHSHLSPSGNLERPSGEHLTPNPQTPQAPGKTQSSQPSQQGSSQSLANATRDHDKWDISIDRLDGNTITFQVQIPVSAPVGLWNCWIQTSRYGQRDNSRDYKCEEDIYVLFNPWCHEDAVYLDSDSNRNEYVLNEQGKIWCGTWRQPKGRKWIFGQFDDVVLPACVFLLEQSGLEHSERRNPIRVSRAISGMVCYM